MSSEPLALDGHVLFVHDHRFISRQGRVFSEVQYDASHWSRYLQVFSQLTVVGREATLRPGLDAARLLLSSRDGVSFELMPDLSGIGAQALKRGVVLARLRALVAGVDCVVARLPSELGLAAVAVARQLDKPCLIEVVDCAWDGLWNYGSLQGKLYAPFMAWRVRRAVSRAGWVHYVTSDFLQRRYPNRHGQQLICSNVDIAGADPAVLAARLTGQAAGQQLTLGLIGTLATRHKGIQTVLAALPELRVRYPQIRFRVLGGGDPKPWLEEAAALGVAECVSFDGVLPPGEAVWHWLDNIDLYLHPSFKEGLPRSLIEAMSRGCPAVASRVGGIPELLDGRCLVRAGDAKALASSVDTLLSSPESLRAQAERNFAKAAEYSREILQARRFEFLCRFRKSTLGTSP